MRQNLRLLGTVAGCCTVLVCIAGCKATTPYGLTGGTPTAQGTVDPTGTPSHGQGTSTPGTGGTPTPVPGQSTPPPAATPPPGGKEVSVGFDVAFDRATATPWNDITQDDLFAIQTSAGSSLDTSGNSVGSVNVPSWVATVHAHHRLALITIGGISDQHWEIACDNTYRSAFVANLVNYMKTNGFDGIDLDIEDDAWSAEGPPSAAMTTCIEAISTAARATTTAAGARPLITEDVTTPWMGPWVSPSNAYVDQFNLMTYGDTCTPSCSTFASDVQKTYSQGVPKAKMVLGIDDIDGYPPAGDCGNIAKYASQQGLAGVMVWDIHTDAVHNKGSFSCFDQLAPYVAPPGA
jgi:chitinase